jgi:transposase
LYSPHYNPIEETFAKLKTWIKKNYALVETLVSFDEFIEIIARRHMASKPGNHFRPFFIEMLSRTVDE